MTMLQAFIRLAAWSYSNGGWNPKSESSRLIVVFYPEGNLYDRLWELV